MTNPAAIAATMSDTERLVCKALCGNAWDWQSGQPSAGIRLMNSLGLMHIDALKDHHGVMVRAKAKPTALGTAVRDHLKGQNDGQ